MDINILTYVLHYYTLCMIFQDMQPVHLVGINCEEGMHMSVGSLSIAMPDAGQKLTTTYDLHI